MFQMTKTKIRRGIWWIWSTNPKAKHRDVRGGGKTTEKEETNELWCRIFPLKMIHSDSASFLFFTRFAFFFFSSSLSLSLSLKRQQFLFGVCGAAVCPELDSPSVTQARPTHCLSVCLPCLKVLKLVARFNRPTLSIYTPPWPII